MKKLFTIAVAWALVGGAANGVVAEIIVDHQPHPYGGLGSDLAFVDPFGQPVWQQVADNLILATPEQIASLNYWGFYQADNPPVTETMRIRVYAANALDGLPGVILREELFHNPSRIWTGQRIGTGILPREFFYHVALSTPMQLEAGIPYWLEVVQIGDPATHFRWEDSTARLDGVATSNIFHNNWQFTSPGGPADAAFQLITPEPGTLALLCMVSSIRLRRQRGIKHAAL